MKTENLESNMTCPFATPILTTTEFSSEIELHMNEPVDGHPLWASRFVVTNKDACVSAYKSLIRAGASVIHTNTYQANIEGFMQHMNLSNSEAVDVIKEAVRLCRRAMQEEGRTDITLGGELGSINAWRADGSEYSGQFCCGISEEEYIAKHRPRIQALIEEGVDYLYIATLPCSAEALALIELLKSYPHLRAVFSFYAKNESQISNGENFAQVAVKCWERGKDQIIAIGVNCLNPALVTPLLEGLKEADPSIPFSAHPNSGEEYDTLNRTYLPYEATKTIADYIPEWLDLGIAVVGGCCRNSAKDLEQMKKSFDNWKATQGAQ